ncbi:phosphoglycerate mutase-like protein [Tilletiopsis washingtonensis]|uniref:Phosphoglycerate mutase-like protein n=1 Tax=Tilletiopsis washingtonensis TaxID=58919 RepID=A0A316Z6W7_9BASI|nr:phosphoglycerate mutase-like protein [Tilletiopsis washingtonensis]PWN95965.1 phosphoglycerate mutase-like protein [Tilletiopsis washingtonensis]
MAQRLMHSCKAHITSLPSNDVAADERATDRFVDSLSRTPADDAEMALPRRDMPALEKSGRPTWLADLLLALRRSARLRLMLLLLVAALVIGAFAAAFAPAGVKGKMYSWGTERWHGKARPYDWDQQVGYAGITKTGAPAGLAQTHAGGSPTRGSAAIETRLPALKETGFRPFEHMGPLSPYVAASDFGVDNTKHRDLPAGCAVSKVHILHRHGSRYPTTGAAPEALRAFHASSASSSSSSSSSAARFSGPLAFLNTWRYKLGAELLVPLGRAQLVESGVKSAVEYGTLMALDTAPPSSSSSSSAAGKEGAQQPQQKMLVRAGSQHRIVESATSWLVGVWGAAWREKVHLEVQIEAEGFNTTLAPNFACPAAGREHPV